MPGRYVSHGCQRNADLVPDKPHLLVEFHSGARDGRWGWVPIIRDLARASSLLYRQSTGLRTRWMVDRFKALEAAARAGQTPPLWGRKGILMGLASNFTGSTVDAWRQRHPEYRTWKRRDLAFVPTVFDRLPYQLCRRLVYRGWWLAGAALAEYHSGFVDLPTTAPATE